MRKALYVLVVAAGLMQIAGYLTRNSSIKGLGAAIASSPLPIVFTEVKGVETFASEFHIEYTGADGSRKSLLVTPEMYSRLQGPYNRRNIYGAAISYGPVLPEALWGSVLEYGICRKTLIKELGIPETASDITIRIKTKTRGRKDEWVLKPACRE